jgi:hypothetical protein
VPVSEPACDVLLSGGEHVDGERPARSIRFSRGYLVSAGIMALILIIALAVLRVSRQDLAGAGTAPTPAGDTSSPNPA